MRTFPDPEHALFELGTNVVQEPGHANKFFFQEAAPPLAHSGQMHGLIGANFALPVCSTIINLSNALTTEDDATGPINVYGRHRLASTRPRRFPAAGPVR